jgi:uncharacterized iron-regulated protein
MKKILLWMVLFFFIPLSLSCVQKTLPHWVSMIHEITGPVGSEEIFKLPEGEKRSLSQFLEELDRPRVIFVGESHDQIEHHRIQVSLLKEFVTQGKRSLSEWRCSRPPVNPILDRWSQGLCPNEFLRNKVDLTWRMDYTLYKGILEEPRNTVSNFGLNVQEI